MLFQLDDLNLSPLAFRLCFSLMRTSYHTKMIDCTLASLATQTQLSEYQLRKGITELVERKLIQATQTQKGYEFVLLPPLVKIINLDWERKAEKAHISPAQLRDAKKKSGFSASLSETSQSVEKPKPKPKQVVQNGNQKQEEPAGSHTKPKPVPKKSMNSHQATENIPQGPWLNSRGCLHLYYLNYLLSYERIESSRLWEVTTDLFQARKFWKLFTEYCTTQVKICRYTGKFPKDLNQYKFWKRIYTDYHVA